MDTEEEKLNMIIDYIKEKCFLNDGFITISLDFLAEVLEDARKVFI